MPAPSEFRGEGEAHFDGYYRLPTRRRLRFVSRYARGASWCEVGFGSGHFLEAARAHGVSITGIDPNAAACARARAAGFVVEQARVEDSEVAEGSFDAVFHVDLLSHFPDPVAALDRMRRLARPDGVVCFEVGLRGHLSDAWMAWGGGVSYPLHPWMFGLHGVDLLLERAGLRRVGLERYGMLAQSVLLRARISAGRLRPVARWVRGQRSPSGLPARSGPAGGLYQRLQHLLRYPVGRWMPDVGPQTVFVAARAIDDR